MTLLGNVLTVGVATLASRVLGFVRDALIAAVLGTSPVADAFVVAFRLPNLFRRLFAEGAFSAAFVPAYVAMREGEGEDAARRFAGAALVLLLTVIGVVSVIAVVWAEALVGLVAPGFAADPGKRALAADLTRLCFPYLAAVSAVALLGGMLGASRRFLAAASAPLVLNLVLIGVLVGLRLAAPGDVAAGRALSIAVSVAGLAQVGLLVAACARARLLPVPTLPRPSLALGRFARALGPGLVAGGLWEINVVVGTAIASLDPGAVSWLYYADRLYQLPLGVVGIAIGQVLLPEIAAAIAGPDRARLHDVQNRTLEFALALALPAAAALVVLAEPIVAVLFGRGAFTAADVAASAEALAVFAVGLPAFVAVKVLAPIYWGRGDTRTPMLIGAAAVAVNVALALALRPAIGWIAVAVATSVAGWVNAGLAWIVLARRGHLRRDRDLDRRLPRLVLAAALLGGALLALRIGLLDAAVAEIGALARLGRLAATIGLGLALWGGLVVALRITDPRRLAAALGRAEPSRHEASCPSPSDRA